jgi:hypothetical protein
MSVKRATHIVLVASTVMLAVGAVPGSAARFQPSDLSSASVSAAGGSLLGSSFVIRDDPSVAEVQPAVAYNPDRQEYLVVFWNDRPGCDDIRAERVSRDGKLLGGVWVAAGCTAERRYPDVAYNSQHDEYLVVWVEERSADSYIMAMRLSADAQPLSPLLAIFSGGSPSVQTLASPAVAYASTVDKYLVVWEDELDMLPPNPDVSNIVGQIVSGATGLPIGSSLTISQDPGGQPRRQPDVAYNRHANGFLVVWGQQVSSFAWNIWSCLIDGDGPPPSFTPQQIGAYGYGDEASPPAVAAIPTAPGQYKFLVVWQVTGVNDYSIYGRLVAEDGTPHASDIEVYWDYYLPAPPWDTQLAVAGDELGKRYMVAWLEINDDKVYIQPLSYDGTQLGYHEKIWASVNPVFSKSSYPAVAAGPHGDFLIAFQRQSAGSDWGIDGQLWGNRVYLPLVLRNAP